MRTYQKKTSGYVYVDICAINLSDSSVADRTHLIRSHINLPQFKMAYTYDFDFYIHISLSEISDFSHKNSVKNKPIFFQIFLCKCKHFWSPNSNEQAKCFSFISFLLRNGTKRRIWNIYLNWKNKLCSQYQSLCHLIENLLIFMIM